jgi:N-acetylmuramate 1-kinase
MVVGVPFLINPLPLGMDFMADNTAMAHSKTASSTAKAPQKLTPPPPRAVADALGVTKLTIDWLAGDGSDRCYFRVRSPETPRTFVLMQLSGADLENLKRDTYDWVEISSILNHSNVLVPRPVSILREHGALVIDDYGDEMLETKTLELYRNGNISGVLPWYRHAIHALSKMLSIRPAGSPCWTRRSFDDARFIWELDFFVTKYLEGVCHRPLTPSEESQFKADSAAISKFLAAGSNYFVHRDFHSRNIMVTQDKVAIIDFQDARLGPASYDVVSLCFDSYVPFTGGQRLGLFDEALAIFSNDHGALIQDEMKAQWKPMLLQRQLKAIGSFGYLTVDKLKGNYLKNVEPALGTLIDARPFDSRWPFISGELIEILAKTLPTRTA